MVNPIKIQNFADHVLIFLLITDAKKCSIFLFQPRKYLKHLDQNKEETMEGFLPEGFLHVARAWVKPVKFTTVLSSKLVIFSDLPVFNLICF